MLRFTALVALSSLVTTSAPVAAKCAMDKLRPKILTASVAVPVGGGGIVVGTESVSDDIVGDDVVGDGEAVQPTWGFLTGRDLSKPVITVIAPGLVVYRVQPTTRTTGELSDGSHVIATLTVTKDKVAKLPAPKVVSIKQASARVGSTGRSTTTSVQLAGTAPADAVAIVLFDAKRSARSWREVTAGEAVVEVFHHGRCEVLPNGTIESKIGDKVTVAWVDKYGRLSTSSRVVAIKGAR